MKECLNYKKIQAQSLQCLTCSHFCKIKLGRVGICGIRQNIGGKLYLLNYGRASAFNVDPIEKKPLFHFLPGSRAYSIGALGCNFKCKNCQNFNDSQIFGYKGRVKYYDEIEWGYDFSPRAIVQEAQRTGCQSVAYTYTEPTVFLEYALDTMKLAKKKKLKNVWISNGFMSEQTMKLIMPYLDAVNIDLKSFDNDFYVSNCGGRLEPVLKNCRALVKKKVWLEITTLIIPTLSDNSKMLNRIAEFIKKELADFVPWHISAFSGSVSWQLQNLPDTPLKTLEKAYNTGKKQGLKYVYPGNVWLPEKENTYCPNCQSTVIERAGYQVVRHDKKGICRKCGYKLEGIYD